MNRIGFYSMNTDCNVYLNRAKGLILALYVDDMLILSKDLDQIRGIKKELANEYDIKDLRKAEYCLGIRVHRDRARRTITIDQSIYIEKILTRFNMKHVRTVQHPIESIHDITAARNDEDERPVDSGLYQQAIGSLIYAMISTRSDVAFSIGKLSQ